MGIISDRLGEPTNESGMVDMEIELSDEEFLYVAKMAHEHDITFNQMINKIMEWYIKEQESGKSNS